LTAATHDEPPALEAAPPPDDQGQATSRAVARRRPTTDATVIGDVDAERSVLGASLMSTAIYDELRLELSGDHFTEPRHEYIWQALDQVHAKGKPVDVINVAEQLLVAKNMHQAGGTPYLHDLIASVVVPENALSHAQILQDKLLRRLLAGAGQRAVDLASKGGTSIAAISAATLDLATVRTRAATTGRHLDQDLAPDVDTFLEANAGDEDYAWLIPGVLERQDRLIVTAGEGHGKSTLLRQLAVQAATGVHPFTGATITPIRVLVVDLENSERQTRRKLRPLRLAAGHNLQPDRLRIMCRVQGLDLTADEDRQWLDNLITATRPDLLITGPIYKLAGGNPNDEKDAKPAATAIDDLRARHDLAVILEAHTAKTPAGMNPRNRPKEPYGWSGWMRWPEFGLHLGEDGTLTHWRGMRDERQFPWALKRGGRWPWSPADEAEDTPYVQRWLQIRNVITMAGRRLSVREVADETGIPQTTVYRILQDRASEIDHIYSQIEEV
jgi:hypothetical protein